MHTWTCDRSRQDRESQGEWLLGPARMEPSGRASTRFSAIGRAKNMASELTGRWIPLFLFNGDKAVIWLRREEGEFYIDFCLPPA